MKNILTYEEYKLQEALALSVAKRYRDLWDSKAHSKIFGKAFRLYFPLGKSERGYTKNEIQSIEASENIKSETQKKIETLLEPKGYTVDNYIEGLCSKKDSKNEFRIGKLISKFGDKSLLDEYGLDAEKQRNAIKNNTDSADLFVVISRHPYDLAGMSTDREWESCMALVKEDGTIGFYAEKVKNDIKENGLIAYLIKKDDMNINKPLGRILIKKFYYKEGDVKGSLVYNSRKFLYLADPKIYGEKAKITGFRETVENWLSSWQKEKIGTYIISPDLYDDGKGTHHVRNYKIPMKKIIKNAKEREYDFNDTDMIHQLLKGKPDKDINEFIDYLITDDIIPYSTMFMFNLMKVSELQTPKMVDTLLNKTKPSKTEIGMYLGHIPYMRKYETRLLEYWGKMNPKTDEIARMIRGYAGAQNKKFLDMFIESEPTLDKISNFISLTEYVHTPDIMLYLLKHIDEYKTPYMIADLMIDVPYTRNKEVLDYFLELDKTGNWNNRALSKLIQNCKFAQTPEMIEYWKSKEPPSEEITDMIIKTTYAYLQTPEMFNYWKKSNPDESDILKIIKNCPDAQTPEYVKMFLDKKPYHEEIWRLLQGNRYFEIPEVMEYIIKNISKNEDKKEVLKHMMMRSAYATKYLKEKGLI